MPFQIGSTPCTCPESHGPTQLIAVTGGPGAGKTAVLELAMRTFCSQIGVLPEAAGLIFTGGFPRLKSDSARRAAQRAIYHVQQEMEQLILAERQVAIAICDRGTPDGGAYWPGTIETFWQELGTTPAEEHAKYSAVIHLRTPTIEQGYNHSNSLRTETAEEAAALDERIMGVWAGHPNRVIINSHQDFLAKAMQALSLIREHLPPCCQMHGVVAE